MAHTLHIVQAFEERDGGIVPVQPKVCPAPHVPWQRGLRPPLHQPATQITAGRAIFRLRGTPAPFIGIVYAPDEKAAIEQAIKEFTILPQHRGADWSLGGGIDQASERGILAEVSDSTHSSN
jgi:hypothetical protein